MHTLFDSLAHELKELREHGLQEQVRTLESRLEE
jgi:hypothetical protein